MKNILILLLIASFSNANPPKRIEFKSLDGLLISADLYGDISNKTPMILLFHQAGWSRGEYREIAPKLVELGFSCMAIDQRSGNGVNDVKNETKARAEKAGKSTSYLDALQDMEAALRYAKENLGIGKLIVWGSSYSAALSFVLSSKYQNDVLGMLAFAPGEYFESAGKASDYIRRHAAKITVPVFVTSAKDEHKKWQEIYNAVPAKEKTFFLPLSEGQHGSRALWKKFPEHQEYWKALKAFLLKLK